MEQDWLSTTDISNTSASSSTSENPHDPTEDDYHEVGWDDNDEEKEGKGEMDEGDDQEETDTALFNLELSTNIITE